MFVLIGRNSRVLTPADSAKKIINRVANRVQRLGSTGILARCRLRPRQRLKQETMKPGKSDPFLASWLPAKLSSGEKLDLFTSRFISSGL
jgi:hypothetical protein